jgi:hypothetical protein
MKNLSIFQSFIIILSLFGFSCEKDSLNDKLPPATTIGASTMAFLVDGKVWIANSDDFKVYKTGARYESSSELMYIYGVNHPLSRLEIKLKNSKKGMYQFTTEDAIKYILYDNPSPFYLDIADSSNSLTITRYDGGIISGTFSFNLKSSDGSTVSITSGRFDIPVK